MPTYNYAGVGFSELNKDAGLRTKAVLASILGNAPIEEALLAATKASLHLRVKKVLRNVKTHYPFRGYYDAAMGLGSWFTYVDTYPMIPLKHSWHSFIPKTLEDGRGFTPPELTVVNNTLSLATYTGALTTAQYADITYKAIKTLVGSPRKLGKGLLENEDYKKIKSSTLLFGGLVGRKEDPLWDSYLHAFFLPIAEPTAPRMNGIQINLHTDLYLIKYIMSIHRQILPGTYKSTDIGKVIKSFAKVPVNSILRPTWVLAKVLSTTAADVVTVQLLTVSVRAAYTLDHYGLDPEVPEESMLFVPIAQTVLNKFSRTDRNKLLDRSLCMAYAAVMSTHVSGWKEALGPLMMIASFVLLVVGIPPIYAAFEISTSFGITILATNILITFIGMKLGELVVKFLIKEFGAENAGVVVVATVVTALLTKNSLATSAALWVSEGFSTQMEKMQADIEMFANKSNALYQDAMDKLNEKQEQIDKMKDTSKYVLHLMLNPSLIYPGESVSSYIDRSRTLSTIPLAFVKDSNNFVKGALALPEV